MLLARHCILPLSFEFKKDSCIVAALEEEMKGMMTKVKVWLEVDQQAACSKSLPCSKEAPQTACLVFLTMVVS